MIPVSVLLILVAVALLVLGLATGSSTLLIGSIVSSLLAAVALVIGARQAAARRRAVMAPGGMTAGLGDDPPAAPARTADARARRAGSDFSASDERDADFDASVHDPVDDRDPAANASDRAAAGRSGDAGQQRDAGHAPPGVDPQTSGPDHDRAASVIGSARSGEPAADAWRSDPPADAPPQPGDPRPRATERDPHAEGAAAADAAFGTGDARSGGAAEGEEFGEPAEDDPADEPLPQAVRPEDAVRVARMDAEVLVVDGRPRYHLADCPHLTGKPTEPLPANEAVELGFSPCGRCRPVDRLVVQTADR